jgi:diaminopimelate epimerase
MCGNGGRCITAFAKKLGLIEAEASFVAIDGPHNATIHNDGTISLHMKDVDSIEHNKGHSILNTGSPHYILWVDDAKQADVFNTGRSVRNQSEFAPGGINVNFVQKLNDGLWVRTYERGVEDETLSCGTGVTAAAIAASGSQTGKFITPIQTPGGMLEISFNKDKAGSAKDVILKGPAKFVFEGTINK